MLWFEVNVFFNTTAILLQIWAYGIFNIIIHKDKIDPLSRHPSACMIKIFSLYFYCMFFEMWIHTDLRDILSGSQITSP
jgi:hypothetical protein